MGNRRSGFNPIGLLAVLLFSLAACTETQEELATSVEQASDVESVARAAATIRRMDAKGIPIFLSILERNVANKYSLLERAKDNICLAHLRDLARSGIYTNAEVPVLLRVLDRQISIDDTLVTAETIKIVTGIDVGYDEQFAKDYSEANEAARQRMLDPWRRWVQEAER